MCYKNLQKHISWSFFVTLFLQQTRKHIFLEFFFSFGRTLLRYILNVIRAKNHVNSQKILLKVLTFLQFFLLCGRNFIHGLCCILFTCIIKWVISVRITVKVNIKNVIPFPFDDAKKKCASVSFILLLFVCKPWHGVYYNIEIPYFFI